MSPILPRDPRGILGSKRRLPWNFWRIANSGVVASSTLKQFGQTTERVCAKPRISTAPPQLGQDSDFALATGGPTSGLLMVPMWRTHSCVPRRDSSRRLGLNFHHRQTSVETNL